MIRLFFVFIILLTAEEEVLHVQGKVTAVHDGNTMDVLTTDGERYHLVLKGIDCPELKQTFGKEAKRCLQKLVLHRKVEVELHGKDRLRNYVGVVWLEKTGDVRLPLLREGLAWTSEKDQLPELEALRTEAMQKKW